MLSHLLLPLFAASSFASISFPSYTSPSDAVSCLKALPQVSCQSSYPVDPNSFATCCYNGALKSGFKESGLVLATQFYDTNPSTGPKDSTTIHGLWPDYCDGSYPQYCTNDSGIPEMTGSQIQALIKEYNPKLLDYMNIYYKDFGGNDPSFWEHEYNKHGTCFTTLRAKCQIPYNGMNQTTAAVVGYFEEIVERFQKLPTFKWLAEAGITPSTTRTYSLAQVQSVLAKKHGGIPCEYHAYRRRCVIDDSVQSVWLTFPPRNTPQTSAASTLPNSTNSGTFSTQGDHWSEANTFQ